MRYEQFNELSFEIRLIRQLAKEQRSSEIEKKYQELQKGLKVGSDDFQYYGSVSICSRFFSYHVLSTYLLLDLIDRFWDGSKFINKAVGENYFLYNELSKKEEGGICEINVFSNFLERISFYFNESLLIFLLPYKSEESWVLKEGMQGHILIIYAGDFESVKNALLEGIAEFYLKVVIRTRLPKWAVNDEIFKEEFIKWCEGKNNKFRTI